jgi:hypothetical protein
MNNVEDLATSYAAYRSSQAPVTEVVAGNSRKSAGGRCC